MIVSQAAARRVSLSGVAAAAAVAALLGASEAQADALPTPPISPPLSANANPSRIDAGPLGEIYVTGALSGLAYTQSNRVPGDNKSRADVTNAQLFVQKTEGPIQFFVQAGGYSIPTIGVPYVKAEDTTPATFGLIPQAYVKIVPNETFNIMVGKLPTLIGAEYTFTFQNTNIQRGAVWNQENAVNRGVQLNFARGPLSASVSLNDGFYSDRYSWLTGLVAYALDESNTIAIAAGGNLSDTGKSSSATPLLQNNQDIVNLIYTHTSGPLTLSPYFQYSRVPAIPSLGILDKGSTTGVALLAKYSFAGGFSLAGRAEYIDTRKGTTNLLYGAGSRAWTVTATPTYQVGAVFVRGELSHIRASDITPGAAFGSAGTKRTQTRALVEAGLLF